MKTWLVFRNGQSPFADPYRIVNARDFVVDSGVIVFHQGGLAFKVAAFSVREFYVVEGES